MSRTTTKRPYARTVRRSDQPARTGLVLAHGAGGSVQANYGGVLDQLHIDRTVVAVDYPGSGQTPLPSEPLAVDDMADQLVTAASAESLDAFAIHGWSLGAPIAVRAAVRHPERVSALVLTSGFARADGSLRLAASIWGDLYAAGDHVLLFKYLMLLARSPKVLDAMTPDQQQAAAEAAAAYAPAGTPAQTSLVATIDVRADLPRISVPTLVISATEDRLVAPALHRQLAQGIPGAAYAELRTGHLVYQEQPAEWARMITSFIDAR